MRICSRCQNTNPDEAAYCYFDGFNLLAAAGDGAAAGPTAARLPHDFFFPSGRRCQTFEELALACQEDWSTACDLLKEGAFKQFLIAGGRLDLAKAAAEACSNPDPDVALDTFLVKLPVTGLPAPRLELEPRKFLLGTMRTGETLETEFRVLNLGKGLLLGTVAVADGAEWLRLEGAVAGTVHLKIVHDQRRTLHVSTKNLQAPREYGAHLTLITNGGIVEVPVRLTVAALPFPKPPYQGAGTPRDLAVRMRSNPKPAVALLESGEVNRWFQANGWPYPVNGPPAQGMAAVQQFFESMGLARPPSLKLSESEIHFLCMHPESALGQVTLNAVERKWVYGRLSCDAPWVRFTTPTFSGPQKAQVFLEVDSSALPAGRHEAIVQVIGNAGRTLPLRVSVDVTRADSRLKPPTLQRAIAPSLPSLTREARPMPQPQVEVPEPAAAPRSLGRTILLGALLGFLLRLLLAGPADIYARVLTAPGQGSATTLGTWNEAPADAAFVKHFVLGTWWLGAVIGLVLLFRRRSHWADVPFGLIAGAAAGLALSGTLACLWPALDWLPRLVWQPLANAAGPSRGNPAVWIGAAMWVAVAALCWAVMGAALGFVAGVLRRLASPGA